MSCSSLLLSLPLNDVWRQQIESLSLTDDQLMHLLIYSDLKYVIRPFEWSSVLSVSGTSSTKAGFLRLQEDCLVQLVEYLDIGNSISQQIDTMDRENQRYLVQSESEEKDMGFNNQSQAVICSSESKDSMVQMKLWFSQGSVNSKGELITIPVVCLSNLFAIPLVPGVKVLLKSGIPIHHGVMFPDDSSQLQVLGGGWIDSGSNTMVEFKREERLELLRTRQHQISQGTTNPMVCINVD